MFTLHFLRADHTSQLPQSGEGTLGEDEENGVVTQQPHHLTRSQGQGRTLDRHRSGG